MEIVVMTGFVYKQIYFEEQPFCKSQEAGQIILPHVNDSLEIQNICANPRFDIIAVFTLNSLVQKWGLKI